MRFEVTTVYTKQDLAAAFMAWQQKEGQLTRSRKLMSTTRMIAAAPSLLVGVVLLIYPLVAGGDTSVIRSALGILLILMGFWMLLSNSRRYYASLAWRNYPSKGHTLRFCFYDDRVDAFDGKQKAGYTYRSIQWIGENKRRIIFFVDDRTGLTISKADFTRGEAGEFGAFLAARSGKNIVPLQ